MAKQKEYEMPIKQNKITKEEMAERLNGRRFLQESISWEEDCASRNKLVIICMTSKNHVRVAGAIINDISFSNDCRKFKLDARGVIPKIDSWSPGVQMAKRWVWRLENSVEIAIVHDKSADPAWQIKTELPHAQFVFFNKLDALLMHGIVIDVSDLPRYM